MTSPNLFELAGRHSDAYEFLFKKLDMTGSGTISASAIVPFLKTSGLQNSTLAEIWELSDHGKCGFLDKSGFFVALKLVSLAQNCQEPTLENLRLDVGAPILTGHYPARGLPSAMEDDGWAIKPSDREKYEAIFESLNPEDGKLSGEKVRPILINSGLPTNILGKIWDLSDIDKDGKLDKVEMCVALHLVYRSLENEPLPAALAGNLVPPGKRRGSGVGRRTSLPSGAVPVLPPFSSRSRASSVTSGDGFNFALGPLNTSTGSVISTAGLPTDSPNLSGASRSLSGTPLPLPPLPVTPSAKWVVDVGHWESVFFEADRDRDKLVNGADIKDLLLQSGLAQNYLAHIWSLVDIKKTGLLNLEQFALAMYLIEQKREGNQEPPPTLPPDLIPPSLRPSPAGMTDEETTTHEELGSSGTQNKEIQEMSREMEQILAEKRSVESAVVQLEADMTVKQSEIKNLEVELSTLDSTVAQLERQQGEAQKRLDNLDAQKGALQKTLEEINQKLFSDQHDLNAMKVEMEQTDSLTKNQENELNEKRQGLHQLREDEKRLEVRLQMERANLDTSAQQHGVVEKNIHVATGRLGEMKASQTSLEEQMRLLEELLVSGDAERMEKEPALLAAVPKSNVSMDFGKMERMDSTGYQANTFATLTSTPRLADSAHFGGLTGTSSPRFQAEDPFAQSEAPTDSYLMTAPVGGDPFGNGGAVNGGDPFSGQDPFASSFPDPFAATNGVDPFASSGAGDPFQSAFSANNFSNDPFTTTVAQTESAPAKGKKPPPRPAPPKNRPVTPLSGNQSPDPWGSTPTESSTGFANFADFSQFK